MKSDDLIWERDYLLQIEMFKENILKLKGFVFFLLDDFIPASSLMGNLADEAVFIRCYA